jgi:hypothetical protein
MWTSEQDRTLPKDAKPQVIMLEFYEPGAAIFEDSVANAVTRLTKTNKCTQDFTFRAQRAMLEEMIFASNEIFDRIRTETHLFSEFASRMAGSGSVKDLKTMCGECGQHQIDFVRRNSERLFKHGERMIETTSKLFNKLATEVIGIPHPEFDDRSSGQR